MVLNSFSSSHPDHPKLVSLLEIYWADFTFQAASIFEMARSVGLHSVPLKTNPQTNPSLMPSLMQPADAKPEEHENQRGSLNTKPTADQLCSSVSKRCVSLKKWKGNLLHLSSEQLLLSKEDTNWQEPHDLSVLGKQWENSTLGLQFKGAFLLKSIIHLIAPELLDLNSRYLTDLQLRF